MIFTVENGCFGYKKGSSVLEGVNLQVKPGEVLSILGPNGVGKTTLLKCMMGLLRWHSGQSSLDGVPLSAIPHRELWKQIAYVPQAKNSAFSYPALEMVVMGRNAHLGPMRQPRAEDYVVARKAMEDVGILPLADKLCNEMSGGELQMVLIARALCADPKMLVLDEPESNLDFKNQLVILDIIHRLARERGISCIFNTHYPAHALKVSTHALLLNRGGKSLFGTASDIVTEENMRTAFSVNVHIDDVVVNDCCYVSVLALSIV